MKYLKKQWKSTVTVNANLFMSNIETGFKRESDYFTRIWATNMLRKIELEI